MVAIGAGTSLLPLHAPAQPKSDLLMNAQELVSDEIFWQRIAQLFTLTPDKTYMNIGTAGSMPRQVQDLYDFEIRSKSRTASGGYTNLLAERTKIATGFGVDPDELAFSSNTTSGMCMAILGLDWQRGDVVVTTNHEHPGGNTPLQIAKERYGIEVSRVELPVGNNQQAETYVELFENRIRTLKKSGKNVRAMMWSSPTYKTGTLLPIALLMEVAKKHGLVTIVDGAHLPGMMAINYSALGMDFMSGAGHKWQCGPGSTGILIIRNKIRVSNHLPLPKWWPSQSMNFPSKERTTNGIATYDIATSINSCGSLNTPMFSALTKSCEIWDAIGRKKIETYILSLSAYLKEKIAERWGIESLYSPKDDPRLTSALSSFNPFAEKENITSIAKCIEYVNRLQRDYQPGFVVRQVNVPVIGQAQEHFPIRISTHLWHNPTDIDRLVDAMWDLSKKMA